MFLPALHTAPSTLTSAPLLTIALGLALLLAGRQLFWLFVGAVGFFAALHLAHGYLGEEQQQWVLVGGVLVGLLGAVLAIFVQKIAVAVAGAVTGAYLLNEFMRGSLAHYPDYAWLWLALAAVVGALLMVRLFRWALIVITSLAGAHLLLLLVSLPPRWLALAYAALFVLGVAWQSPRRKRAQEG